VEESVLKLQKTRCKVAAATLGVANNLIFNLRWEDLELPRS
jgi:hypothetical protein